ncbi:glycosyltransferase family 4 protein [Nitrosovibrio sp. Nv17]|uniref:glycosyltransferase family 4 protein n=1 Tax=Nitrosovibrio sp. Nv17 TaxID=1855339 RepID=UPI0009087231|nr:glycosyltransferase family 4 protein [Nitrosovibrio sp. Nv17]SFW29884.1 Glycosyltransferase involved in cell wall bisynthesis [Nitrosovibrio sp. Nv17]
MIPSDLHIGLVGPLPPPSGGMANQTLQLAGLLRREGIVVDLIQVNRPYRPPGIGRLKGLRALFRLVPYLTHLWRASGRVRLFHVMANSGWSWHLFAAPAIWIAWIRQIPVIVNYRGGEADVFFERSFAWIGPSLRRASAIVVPSAFLEEVFGKWGFPVHVVPNIIDLDRFPGGVGRPMPLKAAAPHLVVSRNLEPIYDNATALRAFDRIRRVFPAATLTIAGTGPQHRFLAGLAAELGVVDAVTFTGRVDNAGMAEIYRRADIMINPSLADNMPISILEALASGVPVVSTDVGGVPHLVTHGETALLVPAGDHSAMADAVLALLGDPGRAERIRAAGLVAVRRYAWPQVRPRLLEVYAGALEQRTAGSREDAG